MLQYCSGVLVEDLEGEKSIDITILSLAQIATYQVQFILGVKVCRIVSEMQTLWNNLSFSLCAVPSVYYMVAISEERKKSEIEVSTNRYVTVEYWRSSSIRITFVNYQTSKLQYNYQSYIQGINIEDAQGFSNIAPITPSRGFNVETLTGV